MGFLDAPRGTGLPALVEKWFGTVAGKVNALFDRVRALDEAEVATVSGDFTMTSENVVVYAGPGGHTITAPPANAIPGRRARPRLIVNNGLAAIAVAATGGQTINGAASTSLTLSAAMLLVPDGDTKTRSIGGNFRATGLTISGSLSVGSTATVTGRLSANGDQIRMSTATQLVAAGAVSGSPVTAVLVGDLRQVAFGTSPQVIIGNRTFGGGLSIGTVTTDLMAFWGATPVVQQVLPTGAGKTADDIIAGLQTLGLFKQA